MPGPDPKPQRRRKPGNARRDAAYAAAAKLWHDRTVAFGCRVCPETGEECDGAILAHHVLRKQFVKDALDEHFARVSLSVEERNELERICMWDMRNGLGVCYRAHRRHHNRVAPIPRRLIPAAAWAFAAELDLTRRLEADYPD